MTTDDDFTRAAESAADLWVHQQGYAMTGTEWGAFGQGHLAGSAWARAQVDRVRELLTKLVDEYGDPVYRGNGWAEGVRDAAREALKGLDGDQ